MNKQRFLFAAKISGIHFLLSFVVALALAGLIFFVWYPFPYQKIMGSFKLFFLISGIDVCCGPLLTFILSNPQKRLKECIIDFSLIIFIQLSAFIYGMYNIYLARPVAVVFELDRIRVLAQGDILLDELPQALPEFRQFPYFGHHLLAVRDWKNAEERKEGVEKAFQGFDIAQQPKLWVAYSSELEKIRKAAKPLAQSFSKLNAKQQQDVKTALQKARLNMEEAFFLPLVSNRSMEWMVILDKNMNITTAVEIDAFEL